MGEITALIASIENSMAAASNDVVDVSGGEAIRSSKLWLQADEWITQLMVRIDTIPLSDSPLSGDAVDGGPQAGEEEVQRRRGVRRAMLQACWDLHERLEQIGSSPSSRERDNDTL
eukprot:CAMPEP_0176463604 /NCGR_PEP_ID=MMETSP0127-20121128/35990_1 /TAXON_ID=938130 /ORGANISM="Platyophrya macrostoma, Strain WH" /LENGTH=115 /DNA_ID=CAMNT_0017855801 /DNA_START=392 /DNA_END=739 /DNA_ORIENTATION=-